MWGSVYLNGVENMTENNDPRHVATKPIMLHSDTVMVLHVYTMPPAKLEEWARDLYLREHEPIVEILKDSADQLVKQLAPNACARFWIELVSSIRQQIIAHDKEFGSNHIEAFDKAQRDIV